MLCPACNCPVYPWRPNVYVCRSCGTSTRNGGGEIALPDEHYASYYEDVAPLSQPTQVRLEEWGRTLERYRDIGRVLEVGCGAGHFLETVKVRGFEPWGTEVSDSAFKLLQNRGFRVLKGDLLSHSLPSSHFDAVALFEVIEHLENPSEYLAECRRLLRQGGVLLLTTPNFKSLSRRLLKDRWRVLQPEHRVVFSSRGIFRVLERVGLTVISVSSRSIDPFEVFRAFRGRPVTGGKDRQLKLDAFRSALTSRPLLRGMKKLTDGLLGFWKIGDTLVVWAEREKDGQPS